MQCIVNSRPIFLDLRFIESWFRLFFRSVALLFKKHTISDRCEVHSVMYLKVLQSFAHERVRSWYQATLKLSEHR